MHGTAEAGGTVQVVSKVARFKDYLQNLTLAALGLPPAPAPLELAPRASNPLLSSRTPSIHRHQAQVADMLGTAAACR